MANQTRQLARLLSESGVAIEVVRTNPPYRPAWVSRFRGLRAAFRLLPYIVRLWQCAGRVDLFHVMANSGWAWHLFAVPAIWIARHRSVTVVVNYRGGEADSFLTSQLRWIRPSLTRASAVVVPSKFLEAVFAKHGFATEIVPNIVDISRFTPAESLPRTAHIVITRNLEPIYDIGTALRAFAIIRCEMRDAHLSVAGSGPQLGDLERLAQTLGIADAVRFTGRIDNDELPAFYRTADLMLNPSTVDNTPISLLEAMASGVPIVSTNVGGIPYLVSHRRTALLVPPRAPELMAQAALSVLADVHLAASLRIVAREAAEGYTWLEVQDRLFRVYERVLVGRLLLDGVR